MPRIALLAVALAATACARPAPAPAPAPTPLVEPRVSSVLETPAPAAGQMTRTTLHETERTATQVLRLAPGATIPEHHHPFFDESFIVERGSVAVQLNGRTHQLRAGDVAVIPAGTVISGGNQGAEEARVVVVFSNTGRPGPLTVPGHPQH